MLVTAGSSEPLGATPDAAGVNFAVFSAHATGIDICLFDADGETERARIRLPERSGDVWHGHVAGIGIGTRYGLRADGPFEPHQGHRFDAEKLLLDPYAAEIDRPLRLRPGMFSGDSAADMAKAIVCAPDAERGAAVPLVAWDRTVIYELQVRGFSLRNPAIPEKLRGTFAALAEPASIAHLTALGVTTVEIMPPAAWIEERHLAWLGLDNAWGYNTIGWMAPDPRLAPGGWAEVRGAVAALAAAGIETIIDVVLNHSGEGDAEGPTLSLRGLDNVTYYRLHGDPAQYVDDTGCGNTLALDRPAVLRLAMDTLRAWARRGGVHGFRFDLAVTLGRRTDGFDPAAPLLSAISQDPELRRLKLIAEPWDPGPGGYQLGAFPHGWGEWNDRFRDDVRRFWRGDGHMAGALGTRLAGSDDVFRAKRRPSRSINYVAAHDGFTLADLVAYAGKHNAANGEDNHDGTDANYSWNNGAEGPSDNPAIEAARQRDQRALLATLMLARGTPMLAMGCELGHTQGGNNNAYAQDNATSWLDWAAALPGLAAYVGRLAALRRDHPVLRDDRFLSGAGDVAWHRTDGQPMTAADWPQAAALVVVLTMPGDRVAMVFHCGALPEAVSLPPLTPGMAWQLALDSSSDAPPCLLDGAALSCPARGVLVLVEVPAPLRAPGDAAALSRLAAAAGIAADWWDIDGTRHPVRPDTQRALLAAMRLPAGSDAEAADSLVAFAEAQQRRALPWAMTTHDAATLPVVLAEGAARSRLRLVLENEDGAQETHDVAPGDGTEELRTCADGQTARVWRVNLPTLPLGRYQIWREDAPALRCALTVAPQTCYLPPALTAGGRRFGIAAHLYAVRRQGDQGIGDFATLGLLARGAAQRGAAVVGLNPLHALFAERRERASPYHPSDRRFIDPIYIDVSAEELGGAALAAQSGEIAALTAAPLVAYSRVWEVKRAVLEAAYARGIDSAAMAGFLAYGGSALTRFATFQAISEQRAGEDWRQWPEPLRDPARATAPAERVRFHIWLQYLADRQLAAAAAESELEIGCYRDLAIGCAPDGAEAWAGIDHLAQGVSVGAPPDPFSTGGQIWHLPPPDPWRMRADGFRSFAGMLGANMRHAGALRIDHAMGLARLFWVPDGASGADGAYVAAPLDDLIGQLALESQRARCLIVGEDLGTVPEGFRPRMEAAQVLSYRVLWFEREGAGFLPPARYPARAVACVSTHDLPTLAGWRSGADLTERAALGQIDAAAATAERAAERSQLAAAVGTEPSCAAVHGFLAAAPSALVLAQIDDLAGETVALNLPGTDRERPNWRRRLSAPVPAVLASAEAEATMAAMRPGRLRP